MKKLILIVVLLAFGLLIIGCTDNEAVETLALQNENLQKQVDDLKINNENLRGNLESLTQEISDLKEVVNNHSENFDYSLYIINSLLETDGVLIEFQDDMQASVYDLREIIRQCKRNSVKKVPSMI